MGHSVHVICYCPLSQKATGNLSSFILPYIKNPVDLLLYFKKLLNMRLESRKLRIQEAI
jgi:hypothetical protein